jgi:hypothetical protein
VGGDGAVLHEGDAQAAVGDEELTVGPVSVSYLDMDGLSAREYRVELRLWPEGELVLTQMGRRHDSFLAELVRSRNRGRVAGLLAHGLTMPEVFEGRWRDMGDEPGAADRPAEIQVYDTHVTLVPEDVDPFQIPFGAMRDVRVADDPYAVTLETRTGPLVLAQLGRKRDACREAIRARLDRHARALHGLTGQSGFADGLGVPRSGVRDFDHLRARFTAATRAACADLLLGAHAGGEPRLGFVQLLDPGGETLSTPTPLPEPWGAFLLVPIGALTVLEILAGPAAATYVFRAPIDAVGTDLQLLHFRRAPLALTEEQAALTLTNPHRLALRRLEPLRRLRACTAARLVHDAGWEEAFRRVIA